MPPVFVTIRPRPSFSLPGLRHQPASSLSLCQEESQYWLLFRNIAAHERSGFFNSVFWTGTILQASHSSPAIKHSLVAIGALYKSLELSSTLPLDARSTSATPAAVHHTFALRQYSKAIRLIRGSFDEGEKTSLRTTLISCILFSCFESFHGDQNAAVTQIHSGINLLNDRQHNASSRLKTRCNDDGVENNIIQLFRDTANSMKTYNIAFCRNITVPGHVSSTGNPADAALYPDIPAVFSTLEEARETWESLKKFTLQFVMSVLQKVDGRYCASTTSGRTSIAALMDRCSVALQPLLDRMRDTQGFLAVNATYLDLKMSLILFHFTFEMEETYLDAYSADFVQLLDLAETVFTYQKQNQNQVENHGHNNEPRHDPRSTASSYLARQQAHFAFDTTIIYPLFYVGTRCRISSVRRRAIALLATANRREGLWDSGLAAKVAQLIMETEEKGIEAGGEIPEERRVTLQGVEYEGGGMVAVVSFFSKGGVSWTVRI
jgi:hypothetical protein